MGNWFPLSPFRMSTKWQQLSTARLLTLEQPRIKPWSVANQRLCPSLPWFPNPWLSQELSPPVVQSNSLLGRGAPERLFGRCALGRVAVSPGWLGRAWQVPVALGNYEQQAPGLSVGLAGGTNHMIPVHWGIYWLNDGLQWASPTDEGPSRAPGSQTKWTAQAACKAGPLTLRPGPEGEVPLVPTCHSTVSALFCRRSSRREVSSFLCSSLSNEVLI